MGQGVLRIIRSLNWAIRIVGTDVSGFTAGNHFCDAVYSVPYSYDSGYVRAIQRIVETENVDLVIPTTDYEIYYLSVHRDSIRAVIAASSPDVARIYLDKYLTFQQHLKLDIPFARTWLPVDYDGSCSDIIVKPREGRGSRGILINPANPCEFSEEFIVQPLYKGVEITTAFYVRRDGALHGMFTMERELSNGTTIKSKVVREYDDQLKTIVEKMISQKGLMGSVNVQSIVSDNREVIPFEVNCRISGTNSIRHNLGFEDVKYTLEEYLFDRDPSKPEVINGVAVRILMDIIYPNQIDYGECGDSSTASRLF